MWHDPIVDDIHRVREAYAAKFNHDIAAMVRDLQEKAKQRQEHPVEFCYNLYSRKYNKCCVRLHFPLVGQRWMRRARGRVRGFPGNPPDTEPEPPDCA